MQTFLFWVGKVDGDNVVPQWITQSEVSKSCRELIKCQCKSICGKRCKCKKANLIVQNFVVAMMDAEFITKGKDSI